MIEDGARTFDVAVIGAGPAGLAVAATAARRGLKVVVLDEAQGPGGQVYRAIETSPFKSGEGLGKDYWHGEALARDMRASGALHLAGAAVWSVSSQKEIFFTHAGQAQVLVASNVVLATGALERPFPIKGWTLPGVMTAGGAQTLLKSSGLLPEGPVVIAGCGPLVWLLASQLLELGKAVDAILDTTPRENAARAARWFPDFLTSPYFLKGLGMMAAVRSRVRVVSGVTDIAASGEGQVQRVAWRRGEGREAFLPVSTLLLHHGVTPNLNLALSMGISHRWNDVQACFEPVTDERGATCLPGIWIVGDGAGIGGAKVAEAKGHLAALAIASAAGVDVDSAQHAARRQVRRMSKGRRFVDVLYRPSEAFRRPKGDVVVCRCEEVSAQQVRETAKLGAPGPNQMKAFLRCGMGPCQGRMCGLTVSELIADVRKVSPADVGYFRLRAPVKPVRLADLAKLTQTPEARKALQRSWDAERG